MMPAGLITGKDEEIYWAWNHAEMYHKYDHALISTIEILQKIHDDVHSHSSLCL